MKKVVVFVGCIPEQVSWGNYTGEVGELVEGQEYTVERVEVHSWHTAYFLSGLAGSFNSVCFDDREVV